MLTDTGTPRESTLKNHAPFSAPSLDLIHIVLPQHGNVPFVQRENVPFWADSAAGRTPIEKSFLSMKPKAR